MTQKEQVRIVKIIKEIKPKVRIVGEREKNVSEKVNERKESTRSESQSEEFSDVEEFKAPSVALERDASRVREVQPEQKTVIEEETEERSRFQREDRQREAVYATRQAQENTRSYYSSNYTASAPDIGQEQLRTAPQRFTQRDIVRDDRVQPQTQIQRVEEREDTYQENQRRRRRYPWES